MTQRGRSCIVAAGVALALACASPAAGETRNDRAINVAERFLDGPLVLGCDNGPAGVFVCDYLTVASPTRYGYAATLLVGERFQRCRFAGPFRFTRWERC